MFRQSAFVAVAVFFVACNVSNSESESSQAHSAVKTPGSASGEIKVSCKPFSESAGPLNKGERSSVEGNLKIEKVLKDTFRHKAYEVEGVLRVTLIDPNKNIVMTKEVSGRGTYEKIRGGLFAESFEYALLTEFSDESIKEIKVDLAKKNMGWVDLQNQPMSYMTNCKL
jgi:hypothetical protein